MPIWNILALLAIILLAYSFFAMGRNAIWGGLTLGIVVGFLIGLFTLIFYGKFNWSLFKKTLVVCTLSGGYDEIAIVLKSTLKWHRIKRQVKKRVEREFKEKYEI